MDKLEKNQCVLTLNHLIFDNMRFERKGFANKKAPKFQFGFDFETREDQEFIVHVEVRGKKSKEYKFKVTASGYFTLHGSSDQDLMMRQNAVAILFPYIRSQISLLTAQPETTPIVLPPMNIAQLVEDAMKKDHKTK